MLIQRSDLTGWLRESELLSVSDEDDDYIPDTTYLDSAIERATADVYSVIAARVSIPLPDPLPELSGAKLRAIAQDIARYYLYTATRSTRPTEVVMHRYNAALDWLSDFAKGTVELPGLTTEEAAQRRDPVVISGTQVFTADRMSRYGSGD